MTGHPQVLSAAAKPFGFAAAAVLVFMMLYTTAAVAMREFFNAPILGVVDVMEFSLVVCIFVALPGTFLRDENVTVDVIDQLVGPRVRAVLRFIGLILTIVFLAAVLIHMEEPFRDKLQSGEHTMTLEFQRFYHWIPIIFGFACSILASLWVTYYYARRGIPPAVGKAADGADDTLPHGGA
jgi:TRAP-type C4-dicarboxylate transport system permease small subunit